MDLHEEDANISTFRRGNKIIAVGFTLIISITLLILILGSAVLLPPILNDSLSNSSLHIPISVEFFCSFSDTQMCITTLNSIVADRFATEPNQIVALCIQTAAKDLQNLITASLTRTRDGNCSDQLMSGSGRVRESLAAAKRPFLGWLGKVRDDVAINRLMTVKEDVDTCIRDSAAPETAAETAAKLDGVNVYLYSAYGFVHRSGTGIIVGIERNNFFHFFGLYELCLCGVQLFMFGFVCLLLRKRSRGVSLSRLYVYCRNKE